MSDRKISNETFKLMSNCLRFMSLDAVEKLSQDILECQWVCLMLRQYYFQNLLKFSKRS